MIIILTIYQKTINYSVAAFVVSTNAATGTQNGNNLIRLNLVAIKHR